MQLSPHKKTHSNAVKFDQLKARSVRVRGSPPHARPHPTSARSTISRGVVMRGAKCHLVRPQNEAALAVDHEEVELRAVQERMMVC
jgi:hypothetical protein